ncbi:hypothetical protein F5887DRAFT_902136, partial [Amanita rubescens]
IRLSHFSPIISGSSVLQVFAREKYEESNLDLYVEETKSATVHDFLTRMGYRKLESSIIATKEALEPEDDYPGKTEIQRVMTYSSSTSDRQVQLIQTSREPTLAVLQFHSITKRDENFTACVMNILTDVEAYCLYPFSTFCEKKTLVCGPTTRKINDALSKYERRGWTVLQTQTVDSLCINPTSEYIIKYHRWVTDSVGRGAWLRTTSLTQERIRQVVGIFVGEYHSTSSGCSATWRRGLQNQ